MIRTKMKVTGISEEVPPNQNLPPGTPLDTTVTSKAKFEKTDDPSATVKMEFKGMSIDSEINIGKEYYIDITPVAGAKEVEPKKKK